MFENIFKLCKLIRLGAGYGVHEKNVAFQVFDYILVKDVYKCHENE